MIKLFTCLLVIAFAAAVQPASAQDSGNPSKAISDAIKTLNGSWEWKESRFASRGVKPSVKNPESTGQHVVVTFKPDNTVLVFRNKELLGTYLFTLTKPQDEYLKIAFSADKNGKVPEYLQEGPLSFSGNELTIAGGYNDAGENVTFRKITAVKQKPAPKK